jgi:hypothetical protein
MMVKHDTCKRAYISLLMLELWTFALTSTRLMYTNHFKRRFSTQDVIQDCCCPQKKTGMNFKKHKNQRLAFHPGDGVKFDEESCSSYIREKKLVKENQLVCTF